MKTPSEATMASSTVNTVAKVMTVAVPALPESITDGRRPGSSAVTAAA
ncbi:hypothetical protein [Streptomyces sp. cmx-4-9]